MRLNHIHTDVLGHLIHSSDGTIGSWHQNRRINVLLALQHTGHHVMHTGICRDASLVGTVSTDRSTVFHAWCVDIDEVVRVHVHLTCFFSGNGGCQADQEAGWVEVLHFDSFDVSISVSSVGIRFVLGEDYLTRKRM